MSWYNDQIRNNIPIPDHVLTSKYVLVHDHVLIVKPDQMMFQFLNVFQLLIMS